MIQSINTLDVFFLSYDEPNADKNFDQLKFIFPNAKRIHGIKGFDAAHKHAASLSSSDYFLQVDADTFVYPNLIDVEIDLSLEIDLYLLRTTHEVTGSQAFTIKIWNKTAILNAKTHEIADPSNIKATLDFTELTTQCLNSVSYGITCPSTTKFHAFRNAFRESFKCSLAILKPNAFNNQPNMTHINRMTVEQLCSIGEDMKYGLYSILGARLGALHAFANAVDECKSDPKTVLPHQIGDYNFMKEFIDKHLAIIETPDNLQSFIDFECFNEVAVALGVTFKQCDFQECQLYRFILSLHSENQRKFLNVIDESQRKSFYFIDKWWDGFRLSVNDLPTLIRNLTQ